MLMYRKFEVIAVFTADGDEPIVDDDLTSTAIEGALAEQFFGVALFQAWMTEEDAVEL